MEKYIVFSNEEETYKKIANIDDEIDTIILDLGDLDINPPFLIYLLKVFRLVKSKNMDIAFISKEVFTAEMNKYFRVFQTLEEYNKIKIFSSFVVKLYIDNSYTRNLLRNLFVTNGFQTKERKEERFLNKEHDSLDKDIYIINFEKYQEEKLEEIQKIKKKNPNSKVILLINKVTAYKALRTVKMGVDSIIEKPINTDEILASVKNLSMQSQLRAENIALNNKIKGLYKNLEKELALANDIQKKLMPPEKINFKGYNIEYIFSPSQKIGGDFCDIFKIDEDKIAVVFADISGHGIPAALLSTMLKAVIHSEFKNYMNIEDLMSLLNERINKIFPMGKFASMFYILLNTKENTISYCKASQEPALLIHDNKVEELQTEGQVLGVFSKEDFPDLVNFEVKTRSFSKDDVILLYTDGITEAVKDDKLYGFERLKENFLKKRNNILALKDTLDTYTLEDDLTLLTIWRNHEDI